VGRGPRRIFIVASLVFAAIAGWLPAVPAHAVTGTVKVFRPPSTLVATCNFSGGANVTLPASCGTVTIARRPGAPTPAEVAAVVGASQNQVVIRNLLIRNGGATAKVEIDARHLFTGVNTNSARAYAIGLNASFSRKNAVGVGILAAGDQVAKQGFYTYFDNGGGTERTDQIGLGVGTGTNLSYTVPSAGSTTANTIPVPAPSATESNRRCADFAGSGGCDTLGERLRTVLSVTLAQNDQVTIPGGAHNCSGDATNKDGTSPGCNAVLGALTAVARLHQNTPKSVRVNPFDNGQLTVELLCNDDFPCENVDRASLQFGPGGAQPESVTLKDLNGDGSKDLRIKVRQQETGITCDDTSATLTGTAAFPGLPDPQSFDAIVGFYTGPGCP
jgi:hypothetical protein